MSGLLPVSQFSQAGSLIMLVILFISGLIGFSGIINLFRPSCFFPGYSRLLLVLAVFLFLAGFFLLGWFHYRIYDELPLKLSPAMADFLNRQLEMMNSRLYYDLPLYDKSSPPRYILPLWMENGKYYFWFMCYAVMTLVAHFRVNNSRCLGLLRILLAGQVFFLFFAVNPFQDHLADFFSQVSPWFSEPLHPGERLRLFMQLYPRMIFYYNSEYMWFHPPLLFLAYGCITVTFAASVFMLTGRDLAVEKLAYDFAKPGYFLLTLGMLLGYPWALKAWGSNWWWDPKICSSIMLWVIYSTYLHTRLYANKSTMWYFSSFLGILCFMAMIFTLLASYFFPGEHTTA
ncbi:MAG: cytochrome c biogenesis protein CcsA [Thermodesulfobacteriota bacterium]